MIFIDTGAFLGRYLARDQYHRRALNGWKRLGEQGERCFTSNLILAETFTLLARRAGYAFAGQRARNLLGSGLLVVLRPDQAADVAALSFFEKYADQQVSFTDCVSFVLMRNNKLKRVFTFDRHFRAAGFTIWP